MQSYDEDVQDLDTSIHGPQWEAYHASYDHMGSFKIPHTAFDVRTVDAT